MMIEQWKILITEKAGNNRVSSIITLDCDLENQSYGFSSSHIWLWELDYNKAECRRIDAFKLWCWRRLLRVPWTARRSNQSILKELSPGRLLAAHGLQHARPPCPSPTSRVYSDSCPSNQWCHPTISFSVVPFSFCLQSSPTSGSFQMSQLFTLGGQNTGISASTSVLPMNNQDWFPLRWTGWISLLSKGISRALSNTTVQKHQFFSAQLSL